MSDEYEKEWRREVEFWSSNKGWELQLCLVAQGYESILFGKLMVLFASGFAAIKIIKELREEIEK